jgi:hypothetical protein
MGQRQPRQPQRRSIARIKVHARLQSTHTGFDVSLCASFSPVALASSPVDTRCSRSIFEPLGTVSRMALCSHGHRCKTGSEERIAFQHLAGPVDKHSSTKSTTAGRKEEKEHKGQEERSRLTVDAHRSHWSHVGY